jgi:hypothetical protein
MTSPAGPVRRDILRMPALDDDFPLLPDDRPRGQVAAVSGNGHGPSDTEEDTAASGRRRRGAGPSVWPATIVVGVALVVLVAGALAAAFSTGPATTDSDSAPKAAPGAPMAAEAAQGALSPITSPGRPPANVIGALVVPVDASVVPGSSTDQSIGLYDRSIGFTDPRAEEDVIAFYRAELPAQGWKILSQGPPHSGTGYEILGQLAGTDGYFWEVGVTVSPTTFAGATQSTPFTMRLFAVSDAA